MQLQLQTQFQAKLEEEEAMKRAVQEKMNKTYEVPIGTGRSY